MVVALSQLARAHDIAGEQAVEPLIRDGVLVAATTTSGLLAPDDVGWGRVCNESLLGTTAWVARDDGSLLRATVDGVFVSTDGGCSFVAEPWFDRPVSAAVDGGAVVWLVAPDPAGDQVYVSVDGGLPTATAPLPTATTVLSAGVGGDGSGWVAGFDAVGLVIARSPDRGASWQPVPPPDVSVLTHEILGPTAAGVLVGSPFLTGSYRISRLDGASFVEVVELPLSVVAGAGCVGGWCFAVAGGAAFRWEDGGDPAATLALADAPGECLVTAADGTLWGCWSRFAPSLVSSTTDGERWTDAIPGNEVHDRVCPAGTPAAAQCPIGPTPDPPPARTVSPTEGPVIPSRSTGCGGGGGGAALGFLAFVRRRRRCG